VLSDSKLEVALAQNRSHAVMAQRTEQKDSLDDFPTPPWATRGLLEHCIESPEKLSGLTCLEPAAGRGFMAETLKEYFAEVSSFDVFDYGYTEVSDFMTRPMGVNSYDWVITNPPFRLAEPFIEKSLSVARRGVAMLTRTVFLESIGRYERLFSVNPPAVVAQFTERVPMVKGRVDKKASTATGYAWLIWLKRDSEQKAPTNLIWVPPCRKSLEKDDDYIIPTDRKAYETMKKPQFDLFAAS